MIQRKIIFFSSFLAAIYFLLRGLVLDEGTRELHQRHRRAREQPSTLSTGISTQLNLPRIFALALPPFLLLQIPSWRPLRRRRPLHAASNEAGPWEIAPPYSAPHQTQQHRPVSNEGDEYFIDVTAIKVDSAPIKFNSSILTIGEDGAGGTKFGTLTPYTRTPYTVLHSAIFKPLVKEFTKKATDRKIKKAALITPFGACFDAKTVKSGVVGPEVPAIVLVLQGDVQWRIEGANSMVRVSEDVMCLGFLDGGSAAIVIGAHQMEDNLVEFDVGSSKFGFSNSLLLQNSSCSHV